EKAADSSARFLTLAEKNPKEPAAVELLFTVIETGLEFEVGRESTARALAALRRDHLASEDLGGFLPMLAHVADPAAEALLREAQKKSPEAETRALAEFSLAESLLRTARRAALVRGTTADKRAEVEAVWGKEAVARYLAADEAKLDREAEEILEQVEK